MPRWNNPKSAPTVGNRWRTKMANGLTHCNCGCIYKEATCPNCNRKDRDKRIADLVKAAFEEGFLAGTADGWVNNPRIKVEWKRSAARTALLSLED